MIETSSASLYFPTWLPAAASRGSVTKFRLLGFSIIRKYAPMLEEGSQRSKPRAEDLHALRRGRVCWKIHPLWMERSRTRDTSISGQSSIIAPKTLRFLTAPILLPT